MGDGYQKVPFDRVTSVSFSPLGSIVKRAPACNMTGNDKSDVLDMIDFASPILTADKPGGIMTGELVIHFEDDQGNPGSRTFHLIGQTLVRDAAFPNIYYNASLDLLNTLQVTF